MAIALPIYAANQPTTLCEDLFKASEDNNVSAIIKLSANGADMNCRNHFTNWTPLIAAARNRRLDAVKVLIKLGASVNAQGSGNYQTTALMWAAFMGDHESSRLLIEAKADPNLVNKKGESALHLTSFAYGGDFSIAQLIQAGADPNLQDNRGNTPLMYAVQWRHYDSSVEVLVNAGTNLDLQNKKGQTALMRVYANTYATEEIMENINLLLKSKANTNLQDSTGSSMLMIAASINHLEAVQALLANGAKKTLRNQFGETASDIARNSGYAELAKIIDLHP